MYTAKGIRPGRFGICNERKKLAIEVQESHIQSYDLKVEPCEKQ